MGKRRYKQKPEEKLEKVRKKVIYLFEQAETAPDQELANRYVQIARKLAMKVRLRMPRGYKRRFCKHCYTYFKQGKTVRVRVQHGKVIYSCLVCKKFMRFPLAKKSSV